MAAGKMLTASSKEWLPWMTSGTESSSNCAHVMNWNMKMSIQLEH